MIEVKEKQFTVELEAAVQSVQTEQKDKLFSYTEKIKPVNLYKFLEKASSLELNRTFWSSATEDFQLAGAGHSFELSTEASGHRYDKVENDWNALLNDAIIYNPYQVSGTGVVALGGFSFDPLKPQTTLWKNFPSSHFSIPSYVLTHAEGTYYLTINRYIRSDEAYPAILRELQNNRKALIEDRDKSEETNHLRVKRKQEIAPDLWKETIKKATDVMSRTTIDKIVLAREVRLYFDQPAKIPAILKRLAATQPNTYVFAYEMGTDCFVGATPERLVKVKDDEVLSTCLAGTAPRGTTMKEDEQIARNLFEDPKNRQEHDYVVQMIRSTMDAYCTNVEVPSEPVVHQYQTLQHLYTPVRAKLKANHRIISIISGLHPTPALGGTPRQDALAFIRDNELLDRGWYGAPIGWMDSNNHGEFAVALRSALIQKDEASLFAGCGIVEDSIPESEYEETNIKLMPMLSVLGVD
ncbi:isochorismate synthase MenF [Oceanobacillus sp. J11TS1]|uniref:isochorismate synthase n=1 Tax=Oceanobacillus sp. J11TS1 TaxID=2807191 RepID=UPI001B10E2C6|nr:isochorismate synthase [Oceanobacillus sp. J11TS1]GIO24937.1 menaquinone-specific isochorismate synthase [Oceanobacillus sp. J11TS1]